MSSFQMWYESIELFIKKTRKNFQITKELLKTEMNPNEVDCNTYKNKKDEWLDCVKQGLL